MLRIGFGAAALMAVAIAPAFADPDVHTVTLPDGSTITTVSDTNSQLWGPSSNQRALVFCRADGPCGVLDSEVTSFNFLSGIWNAIGQAAHRPTRINNATTTNAASSSEGNNVRTGDMETDLRLRLDNSSDSESRGGAAYADGGVVTARLSAEADANANAQQLQGQAQGQIQTQEQTAQGGGNGNGGNNPNGNGGNCPGNSCDDD